MSLPIEPALPALRAALSAHRAAVLEAPPGAGKTTVVPLALLHEPWLAGMRIVMLEPRRLAARAAAARMAWTLGERVGETVGYRVRLDTRIGRGTRIEVVTEGILTRMLQDDLTLDGTGLVIFDEFHERSLTADTGLALTIASAEALRDDLKLLVMSATMDGAAVATLLGDVPVIRSIGRSWPVVTRNVPPPAERSAPMHHRALVAHVARVVRETVLTEAGSVLVFLPGAGEIRQADELLREALPADVSLFVLHGSMPIEAQDAAIAPAPSGRRKVVLATSIAETSLTIDGIRVVVDSGLMRIPRFSARTGMTRLETVRVSRASADQRRGRAGRLEPGVCMRCWSAADDAGLVAHTRPEILDADLAPLVLDLASAGCNDPAELRWLDPPPAAGFGQAADLLRWLGAIDESGRVTPHGTAMARLGTHPRLAHMLLRAQESGGETLAMAATLVALLDERDILRGAGGPPPADIRLRLDAVARDTDVAMLGGATVDQGLVHRVRAVAREWQRRLGEGNRERRPGRSEGSVRDNAIPRFARDDMDVGMLLAFAYPDRVAQRRDAPGRFLLRNGRGATLALVDPLAQAEWIVAAQIDDAGRDGRILLAAPLDPAELLAHAAEQVITRDDIGWNDATASVLARRRTMLGALVLSDSPISNPDSAVIASALLDGVRRAGIEGLPWTPAASALRRRLAFLRHHDAAWPDVSDAALVASVDVWLGPYLGGARTRHDLQRLDLGHALRGMVGPQRLHRLDELAPERIDVPSGSSIALDYGDPAAPVLAVRLQEVFGMTATPMVLGSRVPVTMQLLSPARRPVQVTRDLASFWKTGYFDVRKDLRGRYPKHHWPDDPLAAAAVRGAKRRS